MQFKEGNGWKACYDEKTGKYTAERGGAGSYHLFEITKEIFDFLKDGMSDSETYEHIHEGRHLYMDVNDRCGPPYTVILDANYKTLCPWSDATISGRTWDDDFTDAVVEVMASEADNREQRRAAKAEREKKKKRKKS